MLFGMTRGEIGLVVFIFALVYAAGFLPKVASRLAAALGKEGPPP
jgi:hypothetical protein